MVLQNKKTIPLLIAVVMATAGVVLYFVDPVSVSWTPKCMFHVLTGWQCPGCGISRATHALTHGHIAEALAYNYFFIISIPYFLAVCAVTFIPALNRRRKLHDFIVGPKPALVYVVLFCIWWVVRNILNI